MFQFRFNLHQSDYFTLFLSNTKAPNAPAKVKVQMEPFELSGKVLFPSKQAIALSRRERPYFPWREEKAKVKEVVARPSTDFFIRKREDCRINFYDAWRVNRQPRKGNLQVQNKPSVAEEKPKLKGILKKATGGVPRAKNIKPISFSSDCKTLEGVYSGTGIWFRRELRYGSVSFYHGICKLLYCICIISLFE